MSAYIFLTGATSFLGSRLVKALHSKPDVKLTITLRRPVEIVAAHIVKVQDIDANTHWSSALANQEVVIHAAGRAHIMKDKVVDPLAE